MDIFGAHRQKMIRLLLTCTSNLAREQVDSGAQAANEMDRWKNIDFIHLSIRFGCLVCTLQSRLSASLFFVFALNLDPLEISFRLALFLSSSVSTLICTPTSVGLFSTSALDIAALEKLCDR